MTQEEMLKAIRAEIERRLNEITIKAGEARPRLHGKRQAYLDVLGIIDSLPEEKPSKSLEEELNKWRHIHFDGERDGDFSGEWLKRKTQLKFAQHFYKLGQASVPMPEEQPSKDLEEAAEEYARLDEDGFWQDGGKYKGFIAGAKWQKRQMLEDAVDGIIYQPAEHYFVEVSPRYTGELKHGDKVKIIIIKED